MYSGCSVACISTGQGEGPLAVWQRCAPGPSLSGLMPIVWEWLGAPDHTRRAKGNTDLHGAAGEGCRGESTESFLSERFPSTLRCFLPSPSSFTAHTKVFLSLSITRNLSVSFFIHPLKTNELHSCLCFEDETALPWLQPLPACWMCIYYKCVLPASACECMSVVFCGRSEALCGRTPREGYEEDNNSSENRHWLQLAELSLCALLVFGVSH